mmetsp:Transcript_86510/g.242238  ORF Transcript_86510/g.242238 Transcript_86510/m.242238 type:complete len:489 (-) Transcript_86510:94-1560(-)
MDGGTSERDIAFINAYGVEYHAGVLRCEYREGRGRTLTASRSFVPGDVILFEQPLHIVDLPPMLWLPRHNRTDVSSASAFEELAGLCEEINAEHEAIWYWCALRSLTADELHPNHGRIEPLDEKRQRLLLMLDQGHDVRLSSAVSRIASQFAPCLTEPLKLEQCMNAWFINGFDHSNRLPGNAMYFFPSFASHSCLPNAFWHLALDDSFVMRACCAIEAGDEVTISYLDEAAIMNHTPKRQLSLYSSKSFWCSCERCASHLDLSRGMKCSRCPQGTIFPINKKNPGLPPRIDRPQVEFCASDFYESCCSRCGAEVGAAESQAFTVMEYSMHEMLSCWSERAPTSEELKQACGDIQQWFSEHVIADRMHERLAKYYEELGELDKQIQCLSMRRKFHSVAYSGISCALALVLEEFADAVTFKVRRDIGDSLKDQTQALAEDLQVAFADNEKAATITAVLFGENHEMRLRIQSKLACAKKLCSVVQQTYDA